MTKEELEQLKRIPKEDILWRVLEHLEKIVTTRADSGTLKNIAMDGIRDIVRIAGTQYDEQLK